MKRYDTMFNILTIYNKISIDDTKYFNKKTIKRLEYIQNVSNLNDEIIKIIHKYYENHEYIYDFSKVFDYVDDKNIKPNELINIVKKIDDLNSGLLLITSLLSHNTTKKNSEINHNKLIKHFIELDKKYKEKNLNIKYEVKSTLKIMCKCREKIINGVYKQAKDILKCFSLFILVPVVSNNEFRTLFGNKVYEHVRVLYSEYNLTELLIDCLSKNTYVYRKFKFYKFKQNLTFYKNTFNFIKKIGMLLSHIYLDILNLFYFFSFGFKSIDQEIKTYQKNIEDDINLLRKMTLGVVNNLNNGIVINRLYNYIFDMSKFNIEDEYKNECTFSECSSNFIKETDRVIKRLIGNYIHLNKYLYEERKLLDDVNKKL